MSSLIEMGQKAKDAAVVLATLSTPAKNKALLASANALLAAKAEILAKNKADVDAAVEAGIKGAFIDRLTLTEARLADMAEGLRQVAKLDDPVGEVLSMKTLDNGLVIGQKRVPMGVIGIIFEARPNVAADAFGLCLKAGSAVILRGGKEAFQTNRAVISALRGALAAEGLPEDCVQMVPDTSRETANEMMRLSGYLDVLIPRGGAGLNQQRGAGTVTVPSSRRALATAMYMWMKVRIWKRRHASSSMRKHSVPEFAMPAKACLCMKPLRKNSCRKSARRCRKERSKSVGMKQHRAWFRAQCLQRRRTGQPNMPITSFPQGW